MAIEVGAVAPDFSLQDQHGQVVTLSEFRDRRHVLLVFYPWSFTGICTNELRELQGELSTLRGDRSELLAVSCDSMFAQRVFAEQQGLHYPLLSDFWPHGAVARTYGVFDDQLGAAVRATFVIDQRGVVRWRVVNGPAEPRTLRDYAIVLRDLEV